MFLVPRAPFFVAVASSLLYAGLRDRYKIGSVGYITAMIVILYTSTILAVILPQEVSGRQVYVGSVFRGKLASWLFYPSSRALYSVLPKTGSLVRGKGTLACFFSF